MADSVGAKQIRTIDSRGGSFSGEGGERFRDGWRVAVIAALKETLGEAETTMREQIENALDGDGRNRFSNALRYMKYAVAEERLSGLTAPLLEIGLSIVAEEGGAERTSEKLLELLARRYKRAMDSLMSELGMGVSGGRNTEHITVEAYAEIVARKRFVGAVATAHQSVLSAYGLENEDLPYEQSIRLPRGFPYEEEAATAKVETAQRLDEEGQQE